MIKLFFFIVFALSAGVVSASTTMAKAEKAEDTSRDRTTKPTSATTTAPPLPSPASIESWFDGAVSDILTGADKALNPKPSTNR